MQVKPQVPESLYTFALATVGPYPARYDKILDEAFSAYKLMLGANTLRQIAGGGSNSTAQDAVDRFRTKLHKSLSTRIEFGADIPAEVSAQMSAAMVELWVACVKVAAGEFNQEREAMAQAMAKSVASEQDALASSNVRGERIIELEHDLRGVTDRIESLLVEISGLKDVQRESDARNVQLMASLDARQLDVNRLESQLQDAQSQHKAAAIAHLSDKTTLKQEFNSQISELKREQEIAIERIIKERDSARNTEARERSAHAETTIKLARIEQRLSQATEQVNSSHQALVREQESSVLLRDEMMQLKTRIEVLTRELTLKDDLAAKSQEQLELLLAFRQKLVEERADATTAPKSTKKG